MEISMDIKPERQSLEVKWRSPLHEAAEENDYEGLKNLTKEANFGEVVNAQDGDGRTALMIACRKGYVNLIVLLLEENANVLIRASGGFSCLHEAVLAGNDLAVSLLLGGTTEFSSPHEGSKQVNTPSLDHRKFLLEQKTDGDMFTALHLASIQGHKDILLTILECFVDFYMKVQVPFNNPRRERQIHDIDRVTWGRYRYEMQIRLNEVEKLKEAAAAALSRSPSPATLLHPRQKPNDRQTKASDFAWESDLDYHKRLLDARLDLLICVNSPDCLGRTALHYAAWCNRVDLIDNLMWAGANINAADSCDFTPLHFASRNGNSRVVSKLIESSTDFEHVYLLEGNVASKSNVSTLERTFDSPDWVAEGNEGRPRVLDFVFLEERDGVTPLHYAAEQYGNIHRTNSAGLEFCQLDYVGIVRMLLEIIQVKDLGLFAPSFDGKTLWDVVFPPQEKGIALLKRNKLQRLFNFGGVGRQMMLGAALMRKVVDLAKLESNIDLLVSIQTQLLWTLDEVLQSRRINKKLVTTSCVGFDDETGLSLFHYAAFAGLAKEMRELLSIPELIVCVNQCCEYTNQTPLHIAVIEGHEDVVAALVEVDKVRVIEEDYKKRTPLQIAAQKCSDEKFSDSWKNIEKLLLKRSEVQRFLDRLYKDRQVYVDAANAILVGAALIASVTFAGWLQPPLGYKEYFDILFSPPAPDGTVQSFIAVQQYVSVRAFFIFNSLSFFFAIATVISGAGAVLPAFRHFIKDEVDLVRNWLLLTSVLLVFSIVFVVGAFAAAGFAALPPKIEYQVYMIATAAIGILVCAVILVTFFYRLYLIHPYKGLTAFSSYLRARLSLRFKQHKERARQWTGTAWIDTKYY